MLLNKASNNRPCPSTFTTIPTVGSSPISVGEGTQVGTWAGNKKPEIHGGLVTGHLQICWVYPLVMTNIAIENHHLLWILPLKMVIFHSYVSLPEGIWVWGGRRNFPRLLRSGRSPGFNPGFPRVPGHVWRGGLGA